MLQNGEWVDKNTEYDKPIWDSNYYYCASGSENDWGFKKFHIPSFTFEMLSPDYFGTKGGLPIDISYFGGSKHDSLVH